LIQSKHQLMKNKHIKLGIIILNEYDNTTKIDDKHFDKVFINANELENLGFKENLSELSRPILVISNGKYKIYRKFLQGSNYGISKNQIGILKRDSSFLKIKNNTQKVEVRISNFFGTFLFYFYNPNQEIRYATYVFIWSIPVGLIISIFGAWIYDLIKVL
jgi:hypothetical protein